MNLLFYHDGYKYQTTKDYVIRTQVFPSKDIITEYVTLSQHGVLFIRHGYAWDGPSGPSIDTNNWMVPSLIHDSLCQLLSLNLLSEQWIPEVHKEMYRQCLSRGMWKIRAWYSYKAVQAAWTKNMSRKKELFAE